MAGLPELREIYKKKGQSFIDDLLNSYVVISEKLAGTRFYFQKSTNSQFEYYSRDERRPINLIDRTLVKYYENPISRVENLSEVVKDEIPDNWRFGFEYFYNNSPGIIEYDNTPKSGLILTHIVIKNPAGKTLKVIGDARVLSDWANVLGVDKPPIIFKGNLSENQKNEIGKFISTPSSDLRGIYGTDSFMKYFLKTIDENIEKTTLNNNLQKPIDSIIFKFDRGGKSKTVSAKFVDPWTKELKTKEDVKVPSDSYSLVIVDLMEFVESRGLKDAIISKKSDERYLELMSNIFNDYVYSRGDRISEVDFDTPSFAKCEQFQLNQESIVNGKTREYLKRNPKLVELFKVILSSFRKVRKNTNYILTERIIKDFNKIVTKIKEMTAPVGTDAFMTFSDYIKQKDLNESMYSSEKLIKVKPIEIIKEEVEEVKEIEPISTPKIEVVNLNSEEVLNNDQPGKTKVMVHSDSFQPFTIDDEKRLHDAYMSNSLPIYILVVNEDSDTIDSDLQLEMIESFVEANHWVTGFRKIEEHSLVEVYNACRPKYEPMIWAADESKANVVSEQIEKYSNLGKIYKVDSIVLPPKRDLESKIISAIEIDDKNTFEELVPECMYKYYETLLDQFGASAND